MQRSSGLTRSVLCRARLVPHLLSNACAWERCKARLEQVPSCRNTTAHGVPTTEPASPDWQGPPASYSLQQACKPRTRRIVATRFGADSPLHKLVEDGTLVLYQRSESYTERRDDGYRCAGMPMHTLSLKQLQCTVTVSPLLSMNATK